MPPTTSTSQSSLSKRFLQITCSSTPNRIALQKQRQPTSSDPLTKEHLVNSGISTLKSVFGGTCVNKDRLVYALAGLLFTASSPPPFGGSKMNPGYSRFTGSDPDALLHFIVNEAYTTYCSVNNILPVKLVVNTANHILSLHFSGEKDTIDELMLKGIKKSGHSEWFGAHYIPDHLQHRDEPSAGSHGVEFTMPSLLPQNQQNQTPKNSSSSNDGRDDSISPSSDDNTLVDSRSADSRSNSSNSPAKGSDTPPPSVPQATSRPKSSSAKRSRSFK
ncbi:hypothetical protein HDU79_010853 [Rhizoclosmatium sp. JEL0117]|nr:hypothetical protein HDU79_010853 [Rhizoclosmatium sp. JEL0117]